MAIDLTSRLDEETKKAQAGQPASAAFSPAIPTLGSGLTGIAIQPVGRPAGEMPVVAAPGRDASGVITADSAQEATGKDMQRSGGVAGGIDMAGVNAIMARENKARGEMIDLSIAANGGNGVAVLGVDANGMTQTDRDNAEKSARWRQDDLVSQIKNSPATAGAAKEIIAGDSRVAAEALRSRASYAAEIGRQGITARGQDLSALSDQNRNAVTMRGQDIGANTDAQRLGIDRTRLEMAGVDQSRAADKWGIERSILQGQAADSELIRGARADLSAAIASGDAAKIEAAKAKAVAAGVKFDKPNNEFTAVTDSMGMNVTRTNKDTGAVDIINPKTGEVKSIAAPGQQKAAPAPAGYTVVGTSGGKRVLQDANGNRFVEGGN